MTHKIKFNIGEVEMVDNPTMRAMSDSEYRELVRNDELFFVDHHDVLRSFIADYPLATSLEQLDILIEQLQRLRGKMASSIKR